MTDTEGPTETGSTACSDHRRQAGAGNEGQAQGGFVLQINSSFAVESRNNAAVSEEEVTLKGRCEVGAGRKCSSV